MIRREFKASAAAIEHFDVREVKFSSDKAGAFSGYGAIFGNVDSYGDVIEKGAFKDTLRAWEDKGKYPPMLLQHGGGMFGGTADDLLPIGKWTSMEENSKGLKVEGELFALATERGQYIYEGLKAGALDGMSIGYRTIKYRNGAKAGEPRRYLEQLDLMELSIVTFPANDKARVGAVKNAPGTIREFEDFLRDAGGFSANQAKRIAASGFKSIDAMRDAGDSAEVGASIERLIATLTGK
ncbi:HK97 family phage prohead protease [Bradyrhizobium sp. LM2.7]